MEELTALRLRFDLEALVRDAIRHLPLLPRRPYMRFGLQGGHPTRIPGSAIAAEAAVRPINDLDIPAGQRYAAIADTLRDAHLDIRLRQREEAREQPPSSLHAYLIRFIVSYLRVADDQRAYSEAAFSHVFERFTAEMDRDGWRWVRRTPILNFTIPSDEPQSYEITRGVRIRPLEEEERDEWDNQGFPELLNWASLVRVTHILEIVFEAPQHEVGRQPEFSEDEVLFVLRMTGLEAASFAITEQQQDSLVGG